jgi:LasA protease
MIWMKMRPRKRSESWMIPKTLWLLLALVLVLPSGCVPPETSSPETEGSLVEPTEAPAAAGISATPLPTRPQYMPGELVDYIVQTGDTLPALAAHFNTTEAEIRAANDILPEKVTTLPPGLPLRIPIYYEALWGSPYRILPDDHFVNGPAQVPFDAVEFVNAQPGWFKSHVGLAAGNPARGGELVNHIAANFSISPRLLLAILEYQTRALSQPTPPDPSQVNLLGFIDSTHPRLGQQLVLAANTLNNGYYGWRVGGLDSFELQDGRLERPDPWQNAATVGLQFYFASVLPGAEYQRAVSSAGLAYTYQSLFGDPWALEGEHMPGNLEQPELILPFEADKLWTLTGGPHTGWGEGEPLAALDFAPGGVSGCASTSAWATAAADGVIVRSEPGLVVLDLDGDGDERTGWELVYLHLATQDRATVGKQVLLGEPLGHPSCEGGSSTGTHIHLSRKFNGEWVPAGGVLAYSLDGWVAQYGDAPYEGTLVRFGDVVEASPISSIESQISRAAQ